MDIPCPSTDYQVLEFFAGVGRIASIAKVHGYHAVPIDLTYGEKVGKKLGKRSPMDLNSNAGMVFQVCIVKGCIFSSSFLPSQTSEFVLNCLESDNSIQTNAKGKSQRGFV